MKEKFTFTGFTGLEVATIKKVAKVVSKELKVNLLNTRIHFEKNPKNLHPDHASANAFIMTFKEGVRMVFMTKNYKYTPYTCFIHAACHEFVHVKQYVKDGLYGDKDKLYYKGREYSHDDLETMYKELPWEVEAYSLQDDLLAKVIANANKQQLDIIIKECKKVSGN